VDKDGRIEVRSSLRGDKVIIEVSDNGKGMEPEELEHAFDPFYTTKEVGQGTGLGLFISYNLLQIYQGRIELSSRKGKGTRVTIELPVIAES
jgi:signal transduction histidine kinase